MSLIIAKFEELLILGGDYEKSFTRLQPFVFYTGYMVLFVLPEERYRTLGIGVA